MPQGKLQMLVGKSALIINEMQLGVVDPAHAGFPGLANQVVERGIAARIARLAAAFRGAGLPVFHTPVVHRPDLADVKANALIHALTLKSGKMKEGSVEVQYVPELQPATGDFEIVRTSGMVSICATQLDAILRRMAIETVVITGVSTNIGVAGNAIVAGELGYHVVVPEDCIAGSDPDVHKILVREQLRMVARIVTADDVISSLPAS